VYERFFGFGEKPFSMLPHPVFLYLGRQHSMAYSLLEYAVLNQAGFTVITGDVGCGKTTLIRHLLSQLSEDIMAGLLSNTHKGFADLLRWVLMAFGLDHESKLTTPMNCGKRRPIEPLGVSSCSIGRTPGNFSPLR
jgi:general secretion pathway protein A